MISPRLLPHLLWALATRVAFALGCITTGSDDPAPLPFSQAAAPPLSSIAPVSLKDEPTLSAGNSLTAQAPSGLSATEAQARTFEVLSLPNRVERMRELCALLGEVTPRNWREMLDGFVRQTTTEFRTHSTEWNLMLDRVGEVAGADALAEALSKGDAGRARGFLAGWAGARPKEATEWFEAQPPELQHQLVESFLNGLSRTSPQMALNVAVALPEAERGPMVTGIMNNAIQLGGFAQADSLLKSLMGRTDIDDGARGKLFYDMAHRRMEVAGLTNDAMDPLNWFDGYLGYPKSPAGPSATRELFSDAARKDASATLSWLDARQDRIGSYHGPIAFGAVAQVYQQQMPEQFSAWLASNPNHPQRDVMIEAATAPLLRNGSVEEATRRAGTIRTPELRTKVIEAVESFKSRSGAAPAP